MLKHHTSVRRRHSVHKRNLQKPLRSRKHDVYRVGFKHFKHRKKETESPPPYFYQFVGLLLTVWVIFVFLVLYFTGNAFTDTNVNDNEYAELFQMRNGKDLQHSAMRDLRQKRVSPKTRDRRLRSRSKSKLNRKSIADRMPRPKINVKSEPKSEPKKNVNLDPKVTAAGKALNEVLNLMENQRESRRLKFRHSASKREKLKQKLNQTMSSMIKTHCVETLPFDLDHSAKTTLKLHLQSFIESVYERQKVPSFLINKAVITKNGTIIKGTESEDEASCPLLSALVIRSTTLELCDDSMKNVFAVSDDEIWSEKHDENASNHSTVDAVTLIKTVHQHGLNGLDRAEQLIPKMLNLHCPQIQDVVGGLDSEGMMETIRSVMSILKGIQSEDLFEIERGDIPVIDDKGYLVTIDAMKFEGKRLNQRKRYSACSLIDELVFYRNTDLQDQVEDALNAVKGELNLMAFETKMDVLMEEHCHDVVTALRGNMVHHHHGHRRRGNVYNEVFRGELLKFAMAIVGGRNLGDDRFVVMMNGGILHQSAEGHQLKCPLIDEMVKSSDHQSESDAVDEHRFDPDFEDKAFQNAIDDIMDRIEWKQNAIGKGEPRDDTVEDDADLLWKHKDDLENDPSRFLKTLRILLQLHHDEDLRSVSEEQMEKICDEVAQGIVWWSKHGDKELNGEDLVASVDKENGRIVVYKNLEDFQSDHEGDDNLVQSPLLTALFQRVVDHQQKDDVQEQRNLSDFQQNIVDAIKSAKDQDELEFRVQDEGGDEEESEGGDEERDDQMGFKQNDGRALVFRF